MYIVYIQYVPIKLGLYGLVYSLLLLYLDDTVCTAYNIIHAHVRLVKTIVYNILIYDHVLGFYRYDATLFTPSICYTDDEKK